MAVGKPPITLTPNPMPRSRSRAKPKVLATMLTRSQEMAIEAATALDPYRHIISEVLRTPYYRALCRVTFAGGPGWRSVQQGRPWCPACAAEANRLFNAQT